MKARHVAAVSASAVLVIGGLAACGDSYSDTTSRDEAGQITDEGTVGVFALQVGDCINDPSMLEVAEPGQDSEDVAELTAVPCSELHTGEVVAVDDAVFDGEDEYPAEVVLESRSYEHCVLALEEYTGQSYEESYFDVFAMYPSPESWDLDRDRGVACVGVVLSENTLLPIESTGSMKAA